MSVIAPQSFRAAMARFPGAVTIVTARAGPEARRGITAVCSVTADPPSLLVCLNRQTGTCAAVAASGRFNVNLLSGDGCPLALHFAGTTGATGADKFTASNGHDDPDGLPILTDAALTFCCTVSETLQAGSPTSPTAQAQPLCPKRLPPPAPDLSPPMRGRHPRHLFINPGQHVQHPRGFSQPG
ncbi:MAG: flavin reductase family protein [Cypionkella sp.]|uniref:flavin reductase family protein n=1 Tax=Cypionkella sp. TaxID=2811411 RepID=UPI00271DCFC8|nr:flavin reductase family protein [Cypionkella sp.]MDO8984543.1 flavin reductase family protein [Cypionkella sp.]MDP2049296.1 flavin reductase family protein [Cypionkella sp.]